MPPLCSSVLCYCFVPLALGVKGHSVMSQTVQNRESNASHHCMLVLVSVTFISPNVDDVIHIHPQGTFLGMRIHHGREHVVSSSLTGEADAGRAPYRPDKQSIRVPKSHTISSLPRPRRDLAATLPRPCRGALAGFQGILCGFDAAELSSACRRRHHGVTSCQYGVPVFN